MLLELFILDCLISFCKASLRLSDNSNITYEFEDAEAAFGPAIGEPNPKGLIYPVHPSNACSPIDGPPNGSMGFFALIERGECTFVQKVFNVQKSQYIGAIVVNNADNIFPMGSTEEFDISIPAVMVGKMSGEEIIHSYLWNYSYTATMVPNPSSHVEYYLVPFLIILSLAFLSISIFLLFRVVRMCLQRSKNRLSREALNRLPEIRFSDEYAALYDTCAICLEDYSLGDKLRVLPCNHAYHSKCVDRWLLRRQSSCPVCKYRIRKDTDSSTDSETNSQIDGQPPNQVATSSSSPLTQSVAASVSCPADQLSGTVVVHVPNSVEAAGTRVRANSADYLISVSLPSASVSPPQPPAPRRSHSFTTMIEALEGREEDGEKNVELGEQSPNMLHEDTVPLLPGVLSSAKRSSRFCRKPRMGVAVGGSGASRVFKPPSWLSGGRLPVPSNKPTTWLSFENPMVVASESMGSLASTTDPEETLDVAFQQANVGGSHVAESRVSTHPTTSSDVHRV